MEIFSLDNMRFVIISKMSFDVGKLLWQQNTFLFLDDRYFNLNLITPIEIALRSIHGAYYYNFENIFFYDQFEVFSGLKRYVLSKPHVLKLQTAERKKYFFRTLPFHSRSLHSNALSGDILTKFSEISDYLSVLEGMFCK